MEDPRTAYEDRLKSRRSVLEGLRTWDTRLSWIRLGLGGLILVTLVAFGLGGMGGGFVLLPSGALLSIFPIHAAIARRASRAERAVDYYRLGIERLEGHHRRYKAYSREGLAPENHLYAADLDIFSPDGLFDRLCLARTRVGEQTLASWLAGPAPPEAILSRQEAVRELRGRLDLREDLAVLGEEVEASLHPRLLVAWASRPSATPGFLRILAPALVLSSAACLTATIVWGASLWPFLVSLSAQAAFAWLVFGRVSEAVRDIDQAAADLQMLSAVMSRLEAQAFTAPRLAELSREMESEGRPPSRQIARLGRLVELLDSRRNQIFLPLSYLLLWKSQVSFAIEEWRSRCGSSVAAWLKALGELEALSSLAGYSYENPSDPFPEIVEEVCLEAVGVGHPLIAESRSVRNDLRLDRNLPLLVVSGSNMSGKTTLLRTIGANAVLALAGGPVRARRMRLCPLAIGATLRVQDSLQEGISTFYAEILRLRGIFQKTKERLPVLFMLDEILHGTNSHDRAIGSEALLRGLVKAGAIGLVTTHDLALAAVAESMGPRAANVHFEDRLENGRLVFDYRLQPGVVRKSNALELMRSVGLEVEAES